MAWRASDFPVIGAVRLKFKAPISAAYLRVAVITKDCSFGGLHKVKIFILS